MIIKSLKNRLIIVFAFVLVIVLMFYLIVFALKQNIDLFYTPTQVYLENNCFNKNIKLGGFVKENSLKINNSLDVFFELTDYKHSIFVEYNGLLPDLFAEKKGVVVIGFLNKNNVFMAKQVLAKHDENYVSSDIRSKVDK
ncbi:MAG TPA: cytochrome c maturation protein CcmE [Candidatus Azoamicus sp. OHIO1]